MTQETRDIIYNKKAEELNKDEVGYINILLNKKWAKTNFWFLSIFGTLAGFLLPLILSPLLIVELNVIAPFITGMGAFIGITLGGMFYSTTPSLKGLGLTRKDWKELKKSKRLKELKQVVKEYNQSLKADLDILNEQEAEISDEIKVKEEEMQSLLSELAEVHSLKKQKQNISTDKISHYTQEQMVEMLEIEKNLLLKCLERNKKQQEMLGENADADTLNEVGESAENRGDYLTKALEACKQFNQEFEGETIDN